MLSRGKRFTADDYWDQPLTRLSCKDIWGIKCRGNDNGRYCSVHGFREEYKSFYATDICYSLVDSAIQLSQAKNQNLKELAKEYFNNAHYWAMVIMRD